MKNMCVPLCITGAIAAKDFLAPLATILAAVIAFTGVNRQLAANSEAAIKAADRKYDDERRMIEERERREASALGNALAAELATMRDNCIGEIDWVKNLKNETSWIDNKIGSQIFDNNITRLGLLSPLQAKAVAGAYSVDRYQWACVANLASRITASGLPEIEFVSEGENGREENGNRDTVIRSLQKSISEIDGAILALSSDSLTHAASEIG